VAPYLIACQTCGEVPAINFTTTTERDQQVAHAIPVLQHLLLQLPTIAHQVKLPAGLGLTPTPYASGTSEVEQASARPAKNGRDG
jgi:hypothetical protein